MSPPPTPPHPAGSDKEPAAPSCGPTGDVRKCSASQHRQSIGDREDEPSAPEFDPGQCLFCAHGSAGLDDNMAHMAAAHGFSVPFREFLAVDLETVVSFLRFIICGYRECIACGARRSSVEGARQHMVARGHCRFNVSPDTEELYEMPPSTNAVAEQTRRDASVPVRLPSGKLISHRKKLDTHERRAARRPIRNRERDPVTSRLEPASDSSLAVLQRRGGGGSREIACSCEALLAAQLSRLRMTGARAQLKAEDRKRGRLERANNTVLFKHYRLDAGDGRIGRQF
ncbi:uncharacterized protein MAM_03266 [Metarhizium album ARSEF 1941]|uniref:ZN622/Rei1/Reh1 zinc finger C2H2-type domain-containing protein n=1 Tax=Metarhizium album (strain ARSEF 1941) TaxID=1081103 RepID=A0A0B2WZ19_METAS|nr:uncharacterized protein MAM_03266 [Metarhizium album ARSEF 1941]KHN98804.1 hypothetical protein MAM_03266 [Metarhizium album ARSEF 1941]